MDEEKRNKITAAVVVNAILLVVILVAVVIAQIVEINVKQRRKDALLEDYYQLVREYEGATDFLDKYEKDSAIHDFIITMKNNGFSDDEIYDLLVKRDNKD